MSPQIEGVYKGNAMLEVGFEAINVYGGSVCLEVEKLAEWRNLDTARFQNLLMNEKSVALPNEDPVSFAINAAKPIVDQLSEEDKSKIELLITCSESGIDFGKSMSTYIHHYLGLNRNCRLFELKQACYSGTAGIQMAVNFVLSQVSPGAKALVVATDISRFMTVENNDVLNMDWSFAEPSSGAGSVAVLVSENPRVFKIDPGANGYYGYEVMDTCRPVPDSEAGNADLSLMSYLDCVENTYREYCDRVGDVDYASTFQYLAFHTPFGGMVKGAHRKLMRKLYRSDAQTLETDFLNRVVPGLTYCQRVGNIMGGTSLLSIFSTIDNAPINNPVRIGVFSYGSGCCSEFYSGTASKESKEIIHKTKASKHLDSREVISMELYEEILKRGDQVKFGTRNRVLDTEFLSLIGGREDGIPVAYLKEINDYHRVYDWK